MGTLKEDSMQEVDRALSISFGLTDRRSIT